MTINLFVRQPFTESGDDEQDLVQRALDILVELQKDGLDLHFLTSTEAQHAGSFREDFERRTGKPFTPKNFREHRFSLLDQADAFVNLRVGMSESSAFEIGYNVFHGHCMPMFFAVWEKAPIKTTLLRDLQDLCSVTYVTFTNPEDLRAPLKAFLLEVARAKDEARRAAVA